MACLRKYLDVIQNSQHRKAVTRMLTGDHSLAVVRLSWTDNHRTQVPHDEQLCRFCKLDIETPEHALLVCQHLTLNQLRLAFLESFTTSQPRAISHQLNTNQAEYLAYLASCQNTYPLFAKWVYEVMKVFDRTPLFVPQQYHRGGGTHHT